MNACVAEDFGIPPNRLGSIFSKVPEAMYFSITNSSDCFDTVMVSEIGRRCLFISCTGFSFGVGVIFARFQELGNFCSRYDKLSKAEVGAAKISAYSLNIQLGMPSGPGAL